MKKTLKKWMIAVFLFCSTGALAATKYYVNAAAPNDNGDGQSVANAKKTIQAAADLTNPGDTVFVMNGTYKNQYSYLDAVLITRSGAAGAPIVYTNYPGHSPIVNFNNYQGFNIYSAASYITISGFEIIGNNANVTLADAILQPRSCDNRNVGPPQGIYNGNGIAVNVDKTVSGYSHHIAIRNNKIHDCGGAGIGTSRGDYYTIEDNIIYNNVWYTLYGSSGISFLNLTNSDGTTGYHNFIRRNVLYNNREFIKTIVGGDCAVTDGNGIIIDRNDGSQPDVNPNTLPPYNAKTLVENNIVYNNGGRGIHIYRSNNVDVINNTCFFNCASPELSDGEITLSVASNVNVYNNIMYARIGENANINQNPTGTNYYGYNLIFNSSLIGFTSPTDIVGRDPNFTDTLAKNFTLLPTSPAINQGSKASGQFSPTDILGVTRPVWGRTDIGAYESPAIVTEINVQQGTTDLPNKFGSYAFGQVGYGIPKTVTFTIQNQGGAALNLTGSPRVAVSGTGFSLATDAPATIAAGSSATFDVTLTTSAFTTYPGTISIANNDVYDNPYTFSVSGEGYDETKALQTITFNPFQPQAFGIPDFDAGATASSGLPVSYSSSNTNVATIVNGKIHLLAEGITIITASQAGNATNNPAKSVSQTLTVIGINFTVGNLVVERVGDGTTTLSTNSATVNLLEFTPTTANQTTPTKTLSIGNVTIGGRITVGGTTAYEGQLNLSSDGRYLSLIGYDQPTGTVTATCMAGNKVIGRVDYKGIVDYTTNFPTSASGNAKIAVSFDGSRFWTSINNIGFIPFGQTTTPTAVNSANQRSLGIFKSQLYGLQGFSNLFYTSSALPTALTSLTAAITLPAGQSYEGFAFFDLDPAVSWNSTGYDVVYIANVFSGLEKWYYNGTTWVAANSNANTTPNAYSPGAVLSALTATVNGAGQPVIYGIGGNGTATNNRLYAITDASGRTGTMVNVTNTTTITLSTAGANYAYRGVAFSPASISLLPITLANFTGSLVNGKSSLQWLTASEVNAKEFVVERSADATNFKSLGTVAARNRNGTSSYAFEDASPISGINYYRLRLVDKDGSFKYSNIVAIRLGDAQPFQLGVFPNPVVNNITITHSKATEGAMIKIVSVSGKVLAQYHLAKDATQTSVDASRLAAGQYFVNYVGSGKSATVSFVK